MSQPQDEFDYFAVESVAFGLVYDDRGEPEALTIDNDVAESLQAMLRATLDHFPANMDLPQFEPAEKYASVDCLYLPLRTTPYLQTLRALYQRDLSLATGGKPIDSNRLAYYLGVFHDRAGRKLLGVRRATQFKGIVKARARLVQIVNDALKLVDEEIFRLDADFDYLITESSVWIVRPAGFVYTAEIDQALATGSRDMVKDLANEVPFVDFAFFEDYVASHPTARRLVAALRSRNDLHLTSRERLIERCQENGIEIEEVSGKLRPVPGQERDLLEALDRRRFKIELVDGEGELYRATSRSRV